MSTPVEIYTGKPTEAASATKKPKFSRCENKTNKSEPDKNFHLS